MKKMKAVVYEQFGSPEVLKVKEVSKAVPGNKEVLIKVRATTANAADCNLRGFTYIPPGLGFLAHLMLGFKKPKYHILGSSFAGEIVALGKGACVFQVGDQVFGSSPKMGAYAEFLCVKESDLMVLKPPQMSFLEAATIPYGALTALYFLRDKGKIKRGQKVLINGASGDVGVFAVQIARYFGAEVTGVCSTRNVELVRSLGAQKVIDYTKEDFTQTGEKWDLIMDIVVGRTSFKRVKNSLNAKGYYLAVAGGLNDLLQMLKTSVIGGRKVVFGGGEACARPENLALIIDLFKEENLKVVLDKRFTLDQMVEAHQYVEQGHKRGSVVISVG